MKIVNFNTSYGSKNIGDFIIVESVKKELNFLFKKAFILDVPTHTPAITFYQRDDRSPIMRFCKEADYKFIDGTNIIKKTLLHPWPDWSINIATCKPYKNSILVGAGMAGDFKKTNKYTELIYHTIFSKDYIHSTRDEKTKKYLESIGLKAINTGCATMWGLNKEHCRKIKTNKSNNVIFTLTDYCKNIESDKKIIEILSRNYKNLYFFAQGSTDLDYLSSICDMANIKIVYSLEDYREKLLAGDIDYVGTRLHAGIFAMQNYIRSIIISIDNRTKDIKESYNLTTIEIDELSNLESIINSSFKTNINIDEKSIAEWKNQFKLKA